MVIFFTYKFTCWFLFISKSFVFTMLLNAVGRGRCRFLAHQPIQPYHITYNSMKHCFIVSRAIFVCVCVRVSRSIPVCGKHFFSRKMLMIVTFQRWYRIFLFHMKIVCTTSSSNLYGWFSGIIYTYHLLYVFRFHYGWHFSTSVTMRLCPVSI